VAPTIRRAGPADAEAVRALTRRAYAKWVPLIGREPVPMTADHARAVRDDVVDLAIEGDAIVALVHMVLRPDDLLVENLAVLPEAQGRGLGDMLLAHAERFAAAEGRPAVRLYSNVRFEANLRFYAARGYGVESDVDFPGGIRRNLIKALSEDPGR
jgi:predicted N-acetyltransferase YhbS